MASTYLQRTESAGNRKTFTWSAWVKRSKLGSSQFLAACSYSSSDEAYFFFNGSDSLIWQSSSASHGDVRTNRKFRDTSAWYHIVLAFDTTQATASNRIKFYVNGVEETSFSSATYPNQDTQVYWNVGGTYYPRIGRRHASADYFDGCMSHVAHIDGTQELPTIFGETDSTTGQWKIKTTITPSSGWGTNGYHILKDGNSVTDQSGNDNDFTISGTLTQTEDNPSNVFATFNPLLPNVAGTTSNGNLKHQTTNGSYAPIFSTLGVSSGKWYAEFKYTAQSSANALSVGITGDPSADTTGDDSPGYSASSYGYIGSNGEKVIDSTSTSYGDTYAVGDIIGIALDLDNNYLYFSKNGTFQNSGDPTSGSSGTGGISISSSPPSGFYFMGIGDTTTNYNITSEANFGNGYFGTTAISSEGTNASGIGKFEYDVPTGYTALSTKGLNE